jgi:hypothetical protein
VRRYKAKEVMRTLIVILFTFLSLQSMASSSFEGAWEGAKFNGVNYSYHLLEVDEHGKGFYTYTIGDAMEEAFVFPINLNAKMFVRGYIEIPLINDKSTMRSTLILSRNTAIDNLTALTIVYENNGEPMFSYNWPLVKSRKDKVKNFLLYSFAKKLYNKKLNKD